MMPLSGQSVNLASCLLETFLLLVFLLTIPAAVLIIEIFFVYGTIYIPDDILQTMW